MPEQTILDAAFALIKQSRFGNLPRTPAAALHAQYQDATFTTIEDALRRANELADGCYAAGEQLIGNWDKQPAVLADLEEKFPGFHRQTYDSALSWGVFMAK